MSSGELQLDSINALLLGTSHDCRIVDGDIDVWNLGVAENDLRAGAYARDAGKVGDDLEDIDAWVDGANGFRRGCDL